MVTDSVNFVNALTGMLRSARFHETLMMNTSKEFCASAAGLQRANWQENSSSHRGEEVYNVTTVLKHVYLLPCMARHASYLTFDFQVNDEGGTCRSIWRREERDFGVNGKHRRSSESHGPLSWCMKRDCAEAQEGCTTCVGQSTVLT